MRRAARVDANHAEIVAALRDRGCLVQSLAALGHGVPDLLVGYRGKLYLIEVKTPRGKPTADQVRWQAQGWPVTVVRSVDEALSLSFQESAPARKKCLTRGRR